MTEKERRLARRLGEAIRNHRKRLRLSQAELAEQIGISVDFVGLLERGQRLPAVPVLVALADAFSITIDTLVHQDDDDRVSNTIAMVRALSPEQVAVVSSMLRGLLAEGRPRPSRSRRTLHN